MSCPISYPLTAIFVSQSALTSFYGLSRALSARLCARIQVHDSAKVADLTDAQITQLSAYLSSPGSIGPLSASPTRSPLQQLGESSSSSSSSSSPSSDRGSGKNLPPSQRSSPSADPLRSLVVETDLRRSMQANIAHHRNVGSYRGRRHQQGLPVRGQRSNSNAQTARKLNRIERRGYCTAARSGAMTADSLQSSLR